MTTNTAEYQQWLDERVVTRYGLDKTAAHSDNLIVEEHTLLRDDGTYNKVLAPREGYFYTQDVKVEDITDPANPIELVKATRDLNNDGELVHNQNSDYVATEPSMVVGGLVGKEACLLIVFPGADNPPAKVRVTYQVVGGQFIHSSSTLLKIYENIATGYVEWDDIANKPQQFVGKHHGHNINDVYGWEYVVEAIDRLGRVMELGHIPAYTEMANKLYEIASSAVKPITKQNYINLLDGKPSDEYMSKSDVLFLINEAKTNYDGLVAKTFKGYPTDVGVRYIALVYGTYPLNKLFVLELTTRDEVTDNLKTTTKTLALIGDNTDKYLDLRLLPPISNTSINVNGVFISAPIQYKYTHPRSSVLLHSEVVLPPSTASNWTFALDLREVSGMSTEEFLIEEPNRKIQILNLMGVIAMKLDGAVHIIKPNTTFNDIETLIVTDTTVIGDSHSIKIYLNGVLEKEVGHTYSAPATPTPSKMLRANPLTNSHLEFYCSSICTWDGVITDSQATDLHTALITSIEDVATVLDSIGGPNTEHYDLGAKSILGGELVSTAIYSQEDLSNNLCLDYKSDTDPTYNYTKVGTKIET